MEIIRNEVVIVKLSKQEKEDLKRLSGMEDRNMSSYLRTIIQREIKQGR